ncbi:L-histidine N(alpha)-methyltransferase [Alicyclobacillus sp. ALC3]|uniref:L-histidine N(alpha)-methyltransferase n=1 Tax=Alicyclobacillus sp. ALC3 TaxID=2796143 RepID=UPI0023798A84|nr:L-histidine N(alpha)-methyltransferase [Alicyclobacillus sp. ALC3]WDL98174.1 L-histidine N(alpha)-methyltransferase [Alicyclobacillus sp. ALC3]
MRTDQRAYELLDFQPTITDLRMEVLDGLRRQQKRLDCKLLYDERGSTLFEEITTLPEYYPTRAEMEILRQHAKDIAACIGEKSALIELGSGSGKKVRLLFSKLPDPVAYMAVDISKEFLQMSAEGLAGEHPGLKVVAICADYTQPFELPHLPAKKVLFFPGSTFGNFDPPQGQRFLSRWSRMLAKGDGLLIGIDLKKSSDVLHSAYNDSTGVTAAFNLNLLARLNRELGADFQLHRFEHYAFYNEFESRIEMHIRSREDQVVTIGNVPIHFHVGETIHTENSYKFSVHSFHDLAKKSGFSSVQVWTDSAGLFSVHYLEVD